MFNCWFFVYMFKNFDYLSNFFPNLFKFWLDFVISSILISYLFKYLSKISFMFNKPVTIINLFLSVQFYYLLKYTKLGSVAIFLSLSLVLSLYLLKFFLKYNPVYIYIYISVQLFLLFLYA